MSLIELLIVIAIVGILAAVAMAYYRSQYIVKARLSEVTNSMSVVASSVHNFYTDYNRFPSAADAAIIKASLGVSLPSGAGMRFSDMTVTEGVITATINNIDSSVDGRTLVLRPSTDQNGAIYWRWEGTVPPVYYPKR
jgi:prepilin-type N-terminal cleavage/methylation domain-containing protein